VIDSEFDKKVRAYSNWLNSPYSHSSNPYNSEEICGVDDAIRSLGEEPPRDLSSNRGTIIRNPLQKGNLTHNQQIVITVGARFMGTDKILEGVINQTFGGLEELSSEKAHQGREINKSVMDILRKIYNADC